MKRYVDFKSKDNKKFNTSFSFDWERLLRVTIWVCLLVLVIFIILYIKYRFDLNANYIKNF